MKKTGKRSLLFILSLIIMISILSVTVSANSAEPPSLVILVNNPPADLSIVMISNENKPEAVIHRVAWEGYYVFYSFDMQTDSEYIFKITSDGDSFECILDTPLLKYNNVFTLDISDRVFTPGEYPFRSVFLVSTRVLLTVLLEGVIFWLFKFRQKRSWTIFLIINLVTQSVLNICLNNGNSIIPSYLILSLIFGEVFVFAVELCILPVFINEHKKSRIFICAFIANLISLIAGGYIISVLPV